MYICDSLCEREKDRNRDWTRYFKQIKYVWKSWWLTVYQHVCGESTETLLANSTVETGVSPHFRLSLNSYFRTNWEWQNVPRPQGIPSNNASTLRLRTNVIYTDQCDISNTEALDCSALCLNILSNAVNQRELHTAFVKPLLVHSL